MVCDFEPKNCLYVHEPIDCKMSVAVVVVRRTRSVAVTVVDFGNLDSTQLMNVQKYGDRILAVKPVMLVAHSGSAP